jgi:hypothetical protein
MTNSKSLPSSHRPVTSRLAIAGTRALILASLTITALAQNSGGAIGEAIGRMAGNPRNWTHVVRDGDLLLKYRSSTGEAAVEQVGTHATLREYPAGAFATGWTDIVDTPNGILYYNRDAGKGAVGRLDASGNHNTIQQYNNFSRSWNNVVGTPNGILFYNRNTGSGAVGRIDGSGNFTTVKSYPAGAFAPGWTSIHYSARGIEYRNDATGATATGYIDENGNHITK